MPGYIGRSCCCCCGGAGGLGLEPAETYGFGPGGPAGGLIIGLEAGGVEVAGGATIGGVGAGIGGCCCC